MKQLQSDRILLHRQLRCLLNESELSQMHQFMQHGKTSCLLHSVAVAWYSLRLARLLHIPVSETELVRGALLHDYFLYDWHLPHGFHFHGFRHPFIALKNAQACCFLSKREQSIIKHHMFPLVPLPPLYREAVLVCVIDKICGLYETFHGDYHRLKWIDLKVKKK